VNSNLTCAQYAERMEARTVEPLKHIECALCGGRHAVGRYDELLERCAEPETKRSKS
jgi:hypothetical protein